MFPVDRKSVKLGLCPMCSLMTDILRMHSTKSLEVSESIYFFVVGWEDAGVWRRIAGFQQVFFGTGADEIHVSELESWLFSRGSMSSACLKNTLNIQSVPSVYFHVVLFWLVVLLCSWVSLAERSLPIPTAKGSNELNSNSDTVWGLSAHNIIMIYTM